MGLLDILFSNKNLEGESEENNSFNSYNPQVSSGDFLMTIEDIFTIAGRGTVVTGRVEHGSARVGDNVFLTRHESGQEKVVTITGIEMFRKSLDEVNAGDLVGILLKGITRNEVNKGDVLHK